MERRRSEQPPGHPVTARQTIINVRSGQTYLSAEVAALLPNAASVGRQACARSQARRHTDAIKTTFCPVCGGDKLTSSMRCQNCRNAAISADRARGGSGFAGSARHNVGRAIGAAHPDRPTAPLPNAPSHSSRVHGNGRSIVQAWRRMVMLDGKWIAEADTPEGRERAVTDALALRRLR